MENNSGFSTSDAVLTAAMSGGGFGGRGGYGGGGGMWGGGYGGGGHGSFASPSSIQHTIDRNAQETENQADCTRSILSGGMAGISGAFENAERARQFTDLKDGQFRLELRTGDQLSALREVVNQNAKDAAECCCEVKLENCKNTADLKALIIKENSQTREMINGQALDAANAKITQLETINALIENGHHGGH